MLYFFFFIACLFLSLSINYLIIKYSKHLKINHDTTSSRWTSQSKPGIGGLSFFIVFLLAATVGFFFIKEMQIEYIGIITSSTLAFFLGFFDDKYVLKATTKFFGQFICASILYFCQVSIHITPFEWLNFLFTIFWVVGLMNSINMIDNMDGISSIISISVLLGIFYVLYIQEAGNLMYTLLILGVVGALLGFLFYNWNPSKIMMGDTGSMFLGVFLASMSIVFLWKFRDVEARGLQMRQFLPPLMMFWVTLMDTFTVVFRRTLRGQGFWIGGKDHTTHHLSYLGLSDRQVALFILVLSILSFVMLGLMMYLWDTWKYWYTVIFYAYMIIVLGIMQAIYERAHYIKHEKKP